MKVINSSSILLFVLLNTYLMGQTSPLEADRPDQTETPSIVPVNYIQLESGYSNIYGMNDNNITNLPSLLLKYGLNERLEFRMEIEHSSQYLQSNKVASGIVPVNIGFKVKLWDEKKYLPRTSFIFHYGLPFLSSKDYNVPYHYTTFRFLMAHNITDKLSFSYNIGAEWDGNIAAATGIYTTSISYAFTSKIGAFIEMYGFDNESEDAEHLCDAGITYYITNNLLFDIEGGTGVHNSPQELFWGLGLSYRFKP